MFSRVWKFFAEHDPDPVFFVFGVVAFGVGLGFLLVAFTKAPDRKDQPAVAYTPQTVEGVAIQQADETQVLVINAPDPSIIFVQQGRVVVVPLSATQIVPAAKVPAR